jgi:hypothetical protein
MTILLAHGTLGWYDDLIFLGVIVLFGVMMFIAWFRSRGDNFETDLMPEKPKRDDNDPESPERFQLD